MTTFKSKLTKTDIKHLKKHVFKAGARITLKELRQMFERQAELRQLDTNLEPCYHCREIAQKLGFGV